MAFAWTLDVWPTSGAKTQSVSGPGAPTPQTWVSEDGRGSLSLSDLFLEEQIPDVLFPERRASQNSPCSGSCIRFLGISKSLREIL